MKSVVKRRQRIIRVRRAQHLQAQAVVAQAEGRLASLETSSDRLRQLRESLNMAPGVASGAALANAAEMAMRLDNARDGLRDAIVGAKAAVDKSAELRLEARIRQESAERLGEQAARALEAYRERRAPGAGRRRTLSDEGKSA
ncbi:hypothetical protein SAMN06295912_11934 [Sphingomonas laterariae]|uniref:Flagellar FliJ protein n=1 Tax=Edaphosphingomonas laterariae TaxID=861865 RepID=A0A239HU85_9SPHN|nr:hypothetical protein [Sphingomonas laterariae]SNS84849.1 hypothetical protein SAMN06295912_11934 [Sphingomonas laterariae]